METPWGSRWLSAPTTSAPSGSSRSHSTPLQGTKVTIYPKEIRTFFIHFRSSEPLADSVAPERPPAPEEEETNQGCVSFCPSLFGVGLWSLPIFISSLKP